MTKIISMVKLTMVAAFCASLLLIGCDGNSKSAEKDAAHKAELEAAQKEAKDAKEALETVTMKTEAAEQEANRLAAEKEAAEQEANRLAAEKEAVEAKKKALEDAVKPPAALAMFQAELEKGSSQVKALQVALEALSENSAGDLDALYGAFEKELEATEALAESLQKRKEDMTARGTAYFDLWEKQLASMKTESVRELAEKRREELAEDYGSVISTTQLAGDAYDFFMGQVKEIHEALDDDLSEKTVKDLAPKIKKAGEQAETIRGRISTVVEKLGKIAAIYAG